MQAGPIYTFSGESGGSPVPAQVLILRDTFWNGEWYQ
jgi:hypothetical protein